MNKKLENCDNCDIENQPDPDAECEDCAERALKEGRTIGISPVTSQVLHIRALQKVGYQYQPNDLKHWQWEALIVIDQTLEEHKARELERSGKKHS